MMQVHSGRETYRAVSPDLAHQGYCLRVALFIFDIHWQLVEGTATDLDEVADEAYKYEAM